MKSNGELILPDPAKVTVANVRAEVLPAAASLRKQIEIRGDIGAARELCRQLAAFQKYLQDREGRDLLAAECRRTEVLIGKLLPPVEDTNGRRSDLSPAGERFSQVPPDDRHKFRMMAANEEQVEELLADGKVSRNVILEKIGRRRRVEEGGGDVPEIIQGDMRTALDGVPDSSISLILTDPPYLQESLSTFSDLGKLAERVLVPGGSLVCYTGQAHLPNILQRFGEHLRYWWTFALTHEHGWNSLQGKKVLCGWKPIVWFVKDFRLGNDYIGDRLRGSRPEKAHHEWAQGIEEVQYLIEKLTEPGELILDPFAGSGAFGRAALALGRRFLGVDLNPASDKGQTVCFPSEAPKSLQRY